jgi:hypothetical protein
MELRVHFILRIPATSTIKHQKHKMKRTTLCSFLWIATASGAPDYRANKNGAGSYFADLLHGGTRKHTTNPNKDNRFSTFSKTATINRNENYYDHADHHHENNEKMWLLPSLRLGAQTYITVETVKHLVDRVLHQLGKFHDEHMYVTNYWSEMSEVLAALMLATGLSIGICFDWALKELLLGSSSSSKQTTANTVLGQNGLLPSVVLMLLFVSLHGAAAWEVSNIYAGVTKRPWESTQMFNQFPKASLLVGIAMAPVIGLGFFLLSRLGVAALPALQAVGILLRDFGGILLEVLGDAWKAILTVVSAVYYLVRGFLINRFG